MAEGDRRGVSGTVPIAFKTAEKPDTVDRRQRRRRAYNIEIKVKERGAASVFARSESGKQRCNASADILTENYRQCRRFYSFFKEKA